MNINFDKTDRLIELLEDSCHIFTHFSWRSENSLQKRRKNLYENLVQITTTKKPKKQKQIERIKAFAKEYKLGNDLKKAEAFLKLEFDEEATLKYLTRAYWQIQNLIIVTNDSGNNFADKEGLKKLIEKKYPNEPYKEVIVDVISRQEPRIEDIETEFWSNCTDTDKINDFCNIYRERWDGHLKQIDKKYYSIDAVLFDEKNELYHYFKELRLRGLLQQSELYVEARLQNIAREVNYVSDRVFELFTHLRRSTITKVDDSEKNGTPGITSGGEDYIMPELLPLLKEVEQKIQLQFESWNKIKRAAWVELLMDKGYFLPEYKRHNRRKNCEVFAMTRYKTNIKIQMMFKEVANRNTHKKQLLHYFKDV